MGGGRGLGRGGRGLGRRGRGGGAQMEWPHKLGLHLSVQMRAELWYP